MIVLGGMGNIAGVILGAVLLTVFPEALALSRRAATITCSDASSWTPPICAC